VLAPNLHFLLFAQLLSEFCELTILEAVVDVKEQPYSFEFSKNLVVVKASHQVRDLFLSFGL